MNAAAGKVREGAGVEAGKVFAVTVDTATAKACEAALHEAESHFGLPDILLDGVGGNRGKTAFVDVNEALFQEILGLNLLAGLVTPTRALARRWIEAGTRGCVISLASMTSYKGLSGTWAYNAAKAGVLNLNGCLAKELAPQGIRVNANAPGFVLGHQNRALLVDERTEELTDRGKAIVGRTSFGRLGDMAELHGAALFLARDKAAGFVIGRSEICRSAPSEPHTGSAGSSTPTSPVTASGRSLSFVEARMAELLPLYEYVHSPRSASGLTMSLAPEEARRAVAGASLPVPTTWSSSLGAARPRPSTRLVGASGLRVPEPLEREFHLSHAIPADRRPVVLAGPYGHHSNERPGWSRPRSWSRSS